MVERVLGPILALEGPAGDRLVETIRVWLQTGQRTRTAAQRLGVHPHTLTYRLRRIEQLSGRDLSSPAVIVELWLALEILREEGPAMSRLPDRQDLRDTQDPHDLPDRSPGTSTRRRRRTGGPG